MLLLAIFAFVIVLAAAVLGRCARGRAVARLGCVLYSLGSGIAGLLSGLTIMGFVFGTVGERLLWVGFLVLLVGLAILVGRACRYALEDADPVPSPSSAANRDRAASPQRVRAPAEIAL